RHNILWYLVENVIHKWVAGWPRRDASGSTARTARTRCRGRTMRCPYCKGLEDKVVDSRLAEEGVSVRRRRECLGCGGRFTTFERAEQVGLRVVKRSGEPEPYERAKVVGGLIKACKNRPVSEADI